MFFLILRASMCSSFRKRRPVPLDVGVLFPPQNDIHVVSSIGALHTVESFRTYAV